MDADVSLSDMALIQAASAAISARFKPGWHVVGAALRLKTGEIVTGIHLEANVGRMAVCAEAVALGRAVTEHGSSAIETIVAVYQSAGGTPFVCSPCGMCRELIADYAPDAIVLVPHEGGAIVRRNIGQLLPEKYRRDDESA